MPLYCFHSMVCPGDMVHASLKQECGIERQKKMRAHHLRRLSPRPPISAAVLNFLSQLIHKSQNRWGRAIIINVWVPLCRQDANASTVNSLITKKNLSHFSRNASAEYTSLKEQEPLDYDRLKKHEANTTI